MEEVPLVPFGKYKNKPVTDLIADENYFKWCKTQEWIREKHETIYNICVNQTITTNNQPSKTPDHNKMQNMFLNDDFKHDFVFPNTGNHNLTFNEIYDDEEYIKCFGNQKFDKIPNNYIESKFESIFNWDVELHVHSAQSNALISNDEPESLSIRKLMAEDDKGCYNNIDGLKHDWKSYSKSQLYKKLVSNRIRPNCVDGKPNVFNIQYSSTIHNHKVFIEIKPILGDDYPHVLRKMSTQIKMTEKKYRNAVYVLYVREFSSSAASKEQLKEIFSQHKIKVVFMNDDDNQKTLTIEEENKILKERIKKLEEYIEEKLPPSIEKMFVLNS